MKILRILVLMFCLAIAANAQNFGNKTVLTGTICDDNGAVIQNAKIGVRGKDSFEQVVLTNEDGEFEIKLSYGNYSVEVSSAGFQTFKLEKYRIGASYVGKLTLDVVLEVGPCSDCHRIEVVIPAEKIKP